MAGVSARLCGTSPGYRRWATVLAWLVVTGSSLAQQTQTSSDPLTGGWNPRARFEASGVRPFAVLTMEGWGNAAGGLRTGGWWNQLLDFGFELDTGKLGGWEGGSLLAQLHWAQNSRRSVSFADYTGAFNPVSGIMAGDHVRVYNLYYRQSWREEAVVCKAGQLAADDDFMGSSYTGLFANSAFGALPSQVGNRLGKCCGFKPAVPIYPVAAPGVFLSVRPREGIYGQAGVYYGRPGADTPSNHGFDWASESPPEAALFFEGGYDYKIGERAATLRLGGTYHTGRVQDFARLNAGDDTATRQHVPNFYAVHDLELLSNREGKTVLGLFWRGGVTPDPDGSMVAAYADAGLNWFGPMPGRPEDVAGVAISYTRFGREFRRSTGGAVAADETALELTYKAQVTRWLSLQADAQILFNPAARPGAHSRETAAVFGLRARVEF